MSQPDITVFVSSTYLDNKDRRKLVEDAIHRAGMRAVGMERFAATDKPVVDECERQARECAIYVGIIAKRYGWIPPGSEISITELEYNAAKEAGCPCLMFQIDENIPYKDADLDADDTWEKQGKLAEFKKRFASDQMPSIFTNETLGTAVLHALYQYSGKPDDANGDSGNHALNTVSGILAYQQRAAEHYRYFIFAGFKTRLRVPITLDDLYVPLQAHIDLRSTGEAVFADATDAESHLQQHGEALEIALASAFIEAHRRGRKGVVLLGDPGSGKTTQLKRLLLSCCDDGSEKIGLPANTVPLFVPLRQLQGAQYSLDTLIDTGLAELSLSEAEKLTVKQHKPLLLLIDGLDEVRDIKKRGALAKVIECLPPNCHAIISCRFAGYNRAVRFDAQFLELHVRPLTKPQSDTFIRNWYRAVERGLATIPDQADSIANDRAEALINALQSPDFRSARIVTMLRNPLLLANVCLVHRDRGALPKRRALLYEECIDVLLEHWRDTIPADDGRRVLQPLSLWMHSEDGRITANETVITPQIESALLSINWAGSSQEFLHTIRDDSGLLTGWSGERYGFMHLGFQEYLAACEIRRLAIESGQDVLEQLAGNYGKGWWQEVTLLLLALRNPSVFTPLMQRLLRRPEFVNSDDQLTLLEEAIETPTNAFIERLSDYAAKPRAAGKPAAQLSYQFLSQLAPAEAEPFETLFDTAKSTSISGGDVSLHSILTDKGAIELVCLPSGSFVMGSPEDETGRRESEGPQRSIKLPSFAIGRYPVTNQQYGEYLRENPKVKEPEYWSNRQYNKARQPVVGVSWDDATAFARWAECRLPTEAEWEYACRAGTADPRYHDNINDIAWYSKTADNPMLIGQKHPNQFGLHDMLGNVWEWNEDQWSDSYSGAPTDGSARSDRDTDARVLRGGSWLNDANRARSAARNWNHRLFRYSDIGFRLARTL